MPPAPVATYVACRKSQCGAATECPFVSLSCNKSGDGTGSFVTAAEKSFLRVAFPASIRGGPPYGRDRLGLAPLAHPRFAGPVHRARETPQDEHPVGPQADHRPRGGRRHLEVHRESRMALPERRARDGLRCFRGLSAPKGG